MYVVSSSEPLPSLFKLWPHPGFHMVYLGFIQRKVEVLHLVNFVNIINGNFSM